MYIALVTSLRSNCKKRKVGCVLVRDNRVMSTGMNGTPSGIKNCFEGGCERCNNPDIHRGVKLQECICIHAEENALLEVSRDKMNGSGLYCTSFPCLGCSKKIVQCGVKKIYYYKEYKENEITNKLLKDAGIEIKKIEIRKNILFNIS